MLRIPPMGDRYYVALVVDAAGNVGTRIGRKVTGPGGIDLAFVGPGYGGAVPEGMRVLRQTANDLWLLMRVASTGGADEAVATAILKRFTLSELASVGSRPAEGRNTPIEAQPLVAPLPPLESLEFYQVLDRMTCRSHPPCRSSTSTTVDRPPALWPLTSGLWPVPSPRAASPCSSARSSPGPARSAHPPGSLQSRGP